MSAAATPSGPPVPSRARVALVDVLRGIGIVVVVAGHVVAGLNSAGLLDGAPALRSLTVAAYSVHMPLFAFLSGLFVAGSAERTGRWPYLAERARLLAYLFALWTLIQGGVEIATSGVRNTATTPLDLLRVWEPIAHLWFLPWLLLVTAVAVVVRPWRRGPVAWLVLGATTALALATWGLEGTAVWNRGLPLVALFLAGAALTARGLLAVLARIPRSAAAVGGVAALAAWAWLAWGTPLTVATANAPDRTPGSVALGVAAALLGIAGVVLTTAAVVPPTATRGGVAALVGRGSLAVYLGHIIVAAGVRVVLVRLGVTEPIVLLLAAVALGVAVPLLLERVPVVGRLLFTWPFDRHAGTARAAAPDAPPVPGTPTPPPPPHPKGRPA